MSKLETLIRSGQVSLMDGAMGTELQRAASGDGESFELWNLTHPERVRAVHQAYADAGAQVLLTNTFQANPSHLAKCAAADGLEDIFSAAIANARAAAGQDRLVLADIGPADDIDAATASRMIGAARSADGVILETWSDPRTIRLFADAIAAQTGPPLLVSFAFWLKGPSADVSTFAGYCPEDCARAAKAHGAAGLGINCGRGLTAGAFLKIIRRYRTVADLPIFVRPNAGAPVRVAEGWLYPESPERMAALVRRLLQADVCMVGGCCGTTPAHVNAFRAIAVEWNARMRLD